MSFFGSIFSSDKVVDKAVDGLYSGLDKIVYTEEEKADYNKMKMDLILKGTDLKIKTLGAFQPYKLMQRTLSLLILVPFIGVYLLGIFYMVMENPELSQAIIKANNEILSIPAIMIITFYFSSSVIDSIKKK